MDFIDRQGRQGVRCDLRPTLVYSRLQVFQYLLQDRVGIRPLPVTLDGRNLSVGEQVVQQRFHSGTTFHHDPQKFTSFVVNGSELLVEQLAVQRNATQRLLQVVTGRIRKLVQLVVRPAQLAISQAKGLF